MARGQGFAFVLAKCAENAHVAKKSDITEREVSDYVLRYLVVRHKAHRLTAREINERAEAVECGAKLELVDARYLVCSV